MANDLVIFDHDGGVDDYLSLLLLLTFPNIDLRGVVVTPADCYIEPAVGATRKIIDLAGRADVPVAQSTVRGLNPFPRRARRDSFSINLFPLLNERDEVATPLVDEPGQMWLAKALRAAAQPTRLLVTGPLTTVQAALEQDPTLVRQVREIVWMGGALRVPGNVDQTEEGGQDGSAEWNVYWDPPAAAAVWATGVPVVMCPLDLTNRVRMTDDFIRTLGRRRRYPFCDLAGQCYALVAHQSYYFWDVLTTAYVGCPEMFTVAEEHVRVVPGGPSQGRTEVDASARSVRVLADVDVDRFYDFVLSAWAR